MSTAPIPSLTKTWHTEPYPAIDPTRPELSQQGKTVVITGGGGSIGAAIAKAFALAGASKIALIGRTESTLNRTKEDIQKNTATNNNSIEVLIVPADITNESSITSAFDTIASTFGGKIDIFVSNAGALNSPAPVASVDVKEWTDVLNTNVLGTLYTARAFLRHASSDALLLSVSTAVAHFPPITGFSAYAASKLAATKLLDYVAFENKWLRLVHLQPGSVGSAMGERSGMPALDHPNLPAFFAVWLASPEARFLNRRFTYANWDVEELMAKKEELERNPSDLTLGLYGLEAADTSVYDA